ncbi:MULTISPECIES: phosphoglycerate mutase [Ramlibacter]|uniref:Phosphoglycerate mutase n=1 Tax=Ramlibacter pinisoli TaxID=2682844 RepID=A0A6N8J0U2_9BURK|nr:MULTISPECIES: phosphoglycerate mutase [Ramlibacter]MBA2962513.1 phosphoglycerate mutase [Ramlibacter sp. CGMCC 1.13660]MVQ32455.1 phosphoglycerate mutase [Ramlibacter pinisoli]
MSDGAHLLIPFAACDGEGCRQALATLSLPRIGHLLAQLAPAETEDTGEQALSMPHERALARECGLAGDDGRLPWAAWDLRQAGTDPGPAAWAWITPCHWRLGTGHAAMHHPQELALEAAESQALLAAMQPYFEQDGLSLAYAAPTRWLASGPLFGQLALASLDRVVGRVLDPWMPNGDAARPLRRLQQEMQMLLYTHPVNEARVQAGRLPVNSFWASGAGALPTAPPPVRPAGLQVATELHEAALLQDWDTWTTNWQQLDASAGEQLQRALDAGRPVALTLCGERRARTWRSGRTGLGRRLARLWSRPRPADFLKDL